MYSYEDRMRAVELYFKYGRKVTTVVRELSYPSRKNLRQWVYIYQAAGDLPKRSRPKPKYTLEQKRIAVEHYLGHGCCLAETRRAIGYPSREVLGSWIDELRPGARRMITSTNDKVAFTANQKRQAVTELCDRHGSAQEIAKRVGVSRPMLYKWKDKILGDEAYRSMRKRKVIAPGDERAALLERIAQLEQQVHRLQREHDILRQANELIKKTKASTPWP